MKKISSQNILVVALIIAAFAMGFLWNRVKTLESGGAGDTQVQDIPQAPEANLDAMPEVDKDDHIRGDEDAKVTLVEYSDYECPFCLTFHDTMLQVMDEYEGQVRWVFRHFPLSFHANAQKQAEASECIAELGGNDAFWEFTDKIFERTTSNGTGFALDKLGPLAAEVGVNQAKFQECLDSDKYAQNVLDEMAAGQTAGVNGTPGTIIVAADGSKELVPGALPFDQVKPMIDAALEK